MESKRKERKARKVVLATPDPPKSPQPVNPETLIRINGELIEILFQSAAWKDIVFPLLQESIASVSGRFTNGRFYQGSLTRTNSNRDHLAGYQLALEEFYNRLHDFITAKDNLIKKQKEEALDKKAPLYNPFMEETDLED